MKSAFITGVTGQDGAYLAELLLDKGYMVYGIKRSSSTFNTSRIDHLVTAPQDKSTRFRLFYGDVTDFACIVSILNEIKPDEVYNLAAQSHVKISFNLPQYTTNANAMGVLNMLEAIRLLGLGEKTRFYQASTSELFGNANETPQSETTAFQPESPYAAAKLYGYWITRNYRSAYGIHASNGILFNHESPLRGETFVTRKITRAAAAISLGQQEKLYLGNLDAKRDWGHAQDYVEGMWRILQHDTPDDYVLATGETHTVRDFVERAFKLVGTQIKWQGTGTSEIGIDATSGKTIVEVDPRYFRPNEVNALIGDPSKARRILGWSHTKTVQDIVEEMVAHDLKHFRQINDKSHQ